MGKVFSIFNDLTRYKQVAAESSQEATDSQQGTRVDALLDQGTSAEIQVSSSFNYSSDCKCMKKSHFLSLTAFHTMFGLK